MSASGVDGGLLCERVTPAARRHIEKQPQVDEQQWAARIASHSDDVVRKGLGWRFAGVQLVAAEHGEDLVDGHSDCIAVDLHDEYVAAVGPHVCRTTHVEHRQRLTA